MDNLLLASVSSLELNESLRLSDEKNGLVFAFVSASLIRLIKLGIQQVVLGAERVANLSAVIECLRATLFAVQSQTPNFFGAFRPCKIYTLSLPSFSI